MGRFAGENAARDLLGLPTLSYAQPVYRTCLDLGRAGAVLTQGWDRAVVATGHGPGLRLLKSLAGVLVTVPAWASLVLLHSREPDGPYVILYLLVLVWAADSGAYFAGRKWGKRKLAPVISPGKSWEGVYGGIALCSVLAVAVGLAYGETLKQAAGLLLVSLLTVMFSIVGDLLESLMKRQAGIKDSSNLIPGHGGVLDRIDSLTAAAPVFFIGLHWLKL
jgi:phosphatidate cytidylyltransferase